jgi:hypothetical protein
LLASSGGATGTVSSVAVSGGTTGLTTSGGPITTSGTITLAGTLATTNGGTGLTSFTSGGVVYASSSSALATGSALTFDGVNLTQTGSSGTLAFNQTQAISGAIVNTKTATTSNSLGAYDQFATKDNTGTTNTWAVGVNIATANSSWELYNGGTRFLVTQAGDVGIGTSDPASYSSKLVVVGTISASAGNYLRVWDPTNTTYVQANSPSNREIRWVNDATTEYFRFGSAGQFGIAGANYGLAGQVLTSGGASVAPTWAAAGGGGTTNGKLYFYSSFN